MTHPQKEGGALASQLKGWITGITAALLDVEDEEQRRRLTDARERLELAYQGAMGRGPKVHA